jgi:hypothetical protein
MSRVTIVFPPDDTCDPVYTVKSQFFAPHQLFLLACNEVEIKITDQFLDRISNEQKTERPSSIFSPIAYLTFQKQTEF